MGKFSGKTLLMLGSNVGAVEMIRYAKENGAFTIAADYYSAERSAAKREADEAVLVSTADEVALGRLIEERHIDGVLSGVSEFNVSRAMSLSRRYGLPFYCTLEQWNCIEHKEKFRHLCDENMVPCPKTYYVGSNLENADRTSFQYPLVLKPVDACASKGVFICESERELMMHYKGAQSVSESGLVIIEEFAQGNEFTAHYTICDGKASLSCIDNRYPVAVHEGKVTTIPVARIYPSTYIDEYVEKVNPYMLKLCESLGLKNGVLFVQGIHDSATGKFWIFEAGLRSAGEAPNRFIAKINGIDYFELLVDTALLGKGTVDISKDDPYMAGKCCGIISFVAKHGIVGKIEGLEEATAATASVVSYENRYPVGSETPDTDTLRQLMIRFVMICDSREQMYRDVKYLNEHISVLNERGEDMVIRLDPVRILKEF